VSVTTDDLTGPRAAPLVYDRRHSHPQDQVVGYRVRLTIEDGTVLVKPGNLPKVLGVFPPHRYLDALECARAHRTALYRTAAKGRRVLSEAEKDRAARYALPGNAFVRMMDYACVDSVYRCGCAWGDDDYMEVGQS
jgi:hypothetical protein